MTNYTISLFCLLLLVSTASASDFYVHNMGASSYPNPSVEGQYVMFDATIDLEYRPTVEDPSQYNPNWEIPIFPAPWGEVAFFSFGSWNGPVIKVSNGKASTTVSTLSPGKHEVWVEYFCTNDPYIGCYDVTVEQTVIPYIKSIQISSSPNPSIEGQPVTLTANLDFNEPEVLDPTFSPPIVFVQFYCDGQSLPLEYPYYPIQMKDGKAVLTVPSLPSGTHRITAHYYTYFSNLDYGNPNNEGECEAYHQVNNANDATNIPEFPSVILPIVTILCLIAVFQRRMK